MTTTTAVNGLSSGQPASPPSPPPLSPVQQGDVAAGRARVVDGQVYAVGDPNAPATATWGDQPPGTPYRQTFDAVAARLGTVDRATVTAEIDRQLYGAPVASSPPTAASDNAQANEGVGSFFEGAIKGDLGENNSWSALAGQTVVGFIPVVGQIADIRDTGAAIGQVFRGEEGGWAALGAAAIGWVPGIGDAAKGALRAADNVAEAGADIARRSVDAAPITGLSDAARRAGISEADARRIVDMPKADRPDAASYLPASRIAEHARAFEDGGSRFTLQNTVDKYGLGQRDGTSFIMPRGEADRILAESGGDLRALESALGLPAGQLDGASLVRVDFTPAAMDDLGMRIPSGREAGANDQWMPGGFLPSGANEAVIDGGRAAPEHYSISVVN